MSELKQRLSDELDQLLARVRANKNFQELEHKYHALTERDRLALNVLCCFCRVTFSIKWFYHPHSVT